MSDHFHSAEESALKLLLYGPNPAAPYRTGGVAKWMGYLEQIADVAKLPYESLYIDGSRSLSVPLPKTVRIGTGVAGAVVRALTGAKAKSKNLVLHVNTSLYPRIAYRDGPIVAAARHAGLPILLQIHGGRLLGLESAHASRVIWSQMLGAATAIGVFPGPQFEEFEASPFADNVQRMHNVVPDTDTAAADQSGGARFLYLARLTEAKGVLRLLDAFVQLRRMGPSDVMLTIAGEGHLEEVVRRRIAESGHADAIKFEGFVSGKRFEEIIRTCNVFVLPSDHAEGFPLSFLECAERGMACLITRNSAIRDLFVHDREFLPIDSRDEAGLVATMHRVASDVGLRTRLGRAVQARVRATYTVEAAAPAYRRIYESLATVSNAGPAE